MNNKNNKFIIDNKDNYISISDVAYLLGVSIQTVKRWIKWYESPEFKKPDDLKLPPYYFMDKRLTKYFRKDDIHIFKDFKLKLSSVYWGIMSDFNSAYQWGERGEKRCTRQGKDIKEIKGRIK